MNKNILNKQSNIPIKKSNKSLKKTHNGKSKDKSNKIQNKNKLRQFNKNDMINNHSNHSNNIYHNSSSNLRVKSSKKYFGNKDKNKSKEKINNINSHPLVKNITSLNQHQKKPKKEINNENINTNIIQKAYPHSNNLNQIQINSLINSNKNIESFNTSNKNNNNKNNIIFKSDINNPNFLGLKKEKEKDFAKTELKKISNKLNEKKTESTSIPYFENLKYISLEDTNALFDAWQNCSMIYKVFEEKMMRKNDFEINKNTLELITKNSEACEQLKDQKFWILYIEYLINNNLLINEKQFLNVINEAFSYMSLNCSQLRIYYLQKIKKYSPVFLSDGTLDESDDAYLNKLNEASINIIKKQKGINSSNIKLKSANKRKNFKLENEKEYQDVIKDNQIQRLIEINGNI